MPPPPAETRRFAAAAAAGLALVLVVVVVSAAIRLGADSLAPGAMAALRGIHRTTASLEVLVALWIAWMAWRGRREFPGALAAVSVILALTVGLSIVGIAAGQAPPPAAAFTNLLGGLALAAAFAWLLARVRGGAGALAGTVAALAGGLLVLQALVGARLSIWGRADAPSLPAHAMAGLALAALLAWAGLSRVRGRAGAVLFALALIVPVAGFTALQYEHSLLAALAHAAVAALLLASAAFACSRNA